MERLTMLLSCMLEELGMQLSQCVKRDIEYIKSRCEHEGLSFLTISLAEFGAQIERGIEDGVVHPSMFPGFRSHRRRCLPSFLSGFTNLVFTSDGMLRLDADPDAVFALRQICYLCKKLRLECAPKRQRKALQSYLANEATLMLAEDSIRHTPDYFLDSVSEVMVRSLFGDLHPELIECRHGPGATAERLPPNGRRRIRFWPDRSVVSFPPELHTVPNFGYWKEMQRVESLCVKDEPPVRVVFVPKTLKTPRVIAIEPSHMQYMQQGLLRYMVQKMESHRLTRRSVRFADQQANRDAARAASLTRRFATLDMKDASDLVSLALVQRVFRGSKILEFLEDCRSMHAVLPDGTSVLLRKFASMGSATCFPVEAFVFYVLIQAAVHEMLGRSPTTRSIESISRSVHVYGDDIIVPVAWHEHVVRKLESYSLRVNRHKSFARSHFRESCGGDFYKGVAVRPVYLREVIPDTNGRWDPKAIASLTASSNWFYRLGLWKTSQLLREFVETALRSRLPKSTYETTGLTAYSCCFDTYHRWNNDLHRWERRVRKLAAVRVEDDVREDEVASMFLALRNIGNETSVSLETSVRARALTIKRGWAR